MKKALLFLLITGSFGSLLAQNCNAVFFNQEGKRFHLILNGILQNSAFETNVKVTDLSHEASYKVTINFEDEMLPNVEKTIYMVDPSTEYTYNIKQNKKGKYVLRAMSMVPIAQAPAPAPTQTVMVYSTTPAQPAPVVTETVTTTTTTNVQNTGTQDNVSMGVNVDGVSLNMNVSVNDGGMNAQTTSTTYTETTMTTTTSSTYTEEPAPVVEEHYVMPGYNGPVGCSYPMTDTDFNSAKKSISSKSFSDSRLTLAKQITKTNCLTSEQAKQIIQLFDFEDTRLEYAKFAYGHTYDIGNYYKVNDAFEFESSIEELNEYIEGR